jgi:hypothetical protein
MRKVLIALAIVAALVAIGGGASLAASGDGASRRFTLNAKADFFKNVDPTGGQFGPGDYLVEGLVLARAGRPAGRDDDQCMVVGGRGPVAVCTYFITINGHGLLAASARVTFRPFDQGFLPPPFDAAVTGGTGDYRSARGQVRITFTDHEHATFAFDLR